MIISTFSIVAVDSETGEVGIAVASKVFDVGYIVPWLEAEYGGVASQAYANPFLGPWILSSLSRGKPAGEALRIALSRDTMPEVRQVGVVDRHGYSAAHTGRDCLAWAGHRTGRWVSVQGNILTGPEVVDSMFAVFIRTKGPLAERLLAALEAGDRAGGDRRGRQSAALYVVRKRGGYQGADDRLVDLKVVDNPEPIKELRRLYDSWQYTFLAAAYLRLANEEGKDVFLRRARKLAETALVSTLKDPYLYNNLAWEFALKRIYPDLTLKLAHRAHELAPEDANIMDTMAEAYYAAGNWRMAIHWEKKALEKEPENEFFKKQLRRFEEGGK
ncbi:fimbrial assembly protein FimA [candidate division WOR-3 bacterium]|uniref:Fimbrial assembly protein FimA n=1 Tax=candidate division WOR-3 bacterium TaxID=2052148 RepID=A0A660SE53_UNCW3|nr:MAG: fimbrial assembly protein FimA [candidate division WOR-3 bacterium]